MILALLSKQHWTADSFVEATALGFPAWDEGAQGLQIARVNLSGNDTLLHIRPDNDSTN